MKKLFSILITLLMIVSFAVCAQANDDESILLRVDETVDLGVNEYVFLSPYVFPSEAKLTYSSSTPSVASVNAYGKVLAKKVGKTVITVTATLGGNSVSRTVGVTVFKAPAKVYIGGPTKMTAGKGQIIGFDPYVNSGSCGSITLSVSNKNLAKLGQEAIEIVGESGTVKVIARAYNGRTATCTITIKKAPVEGTVSLNKSAVKLGVGMTDRLSIRYANGYGGEYSFESSDESVATVSADGTVKGISAGTATVYAITYNEIKVPCEVTVLPGPSANDIHVNNEEIMIGVKESYTVVPTYSDAFMTKLSYSSGAPSVAKVSASGKITGVKVGEANVTISTLTGETKQIHITVMPAPFNITLNRTSATMYGGQTEQLIAAANAGTAGRITWSSSNSKLATVDENGVVTVLGTSGTVKITAKTYNGKSAGCNITLKKEPTEGTVKLSKSDMSLAVGMSDRVSVSFTKGYGAEYAFESSDPAVASVSGKGTVTALAPGEAVISAVMKNGVSVQCKVKVYAAPSAGDISLNVSALTLGVSETFMLSADYDHSTYMTKLTYSSGKNSVAKVSSTGKITAVKAGTAVITVRTSNGIVMSVPVTVKKAPAKLTLSANRVFVQKGDSVQLLASVNDGAAGKITWTSSNSRLATVDQNGVVTVIGESGTVMITAKTFNGKSAVCTVVIEQETPADPPADPVDPPTDPTDPPANNDPQDDPGNNTDGPGNTDDPVNNNDDPGTTDTDHSNDNSEGSNTNNDPTQNDVPQTQDEPKSGHWEQVLVVDVERVSHDEWECNYCHERQLSAKECNRHQEAHALADEPTGYKVVTVVDVPEQDHIEEVWVED